MLCFPTQNLTILLIFHLFFTFYFSFFSCWVAYFHVIHASEFSASHSAKNCIKGSEEGLSQVIIQWVTSWFCCFYQIKKSSNKIHHFCKETILKTYSKFLFDNFILSNSVFCATAEICIISALMSCSLFSFIRNYFLSPILTSET